MTAHRPCQRRNSIAPPAKRVDAGTIIAMGHRVTRVALQRISKSFTSLQGRAYVAIDSLDLELSDGEFFCLLGPSGCGKTSVLNMIAGFERPSAGVALVDG